MSFRLSLPVKFHRVTANGTITSVETRYSFIEALRATLKTSFPDLPPLDSKRLYGSLSSGVINERTRVINNFLRACQEHEAITSSREWSQLLHGQKPGGSLEAGSNPTPAQLRSGEGKTDAAPAASLAEKPAAVKGMSFRSFFEGALRGESNGPTAPSAPSSTEDMEEGGEPHSQPHLESISEVVDSEDEDDRECVVANGAAIATPRQVMVFEFYKMTMERKQGRQAQGNVVKNLIEGTPEDLERGLGYKDRIVRSLPPLIYEFLGK